MKNGPERSYVGSDLHRRGDGEKVNESGTCFEGRGRGEKDTPEALTQEIRSANVFNKAGRRTRKRGEAARTNTGPFA